MKVVSTPSDARQVTDETGNTTSSLNSPNDFVTLIAQTVLASDDSKKPIEGDQASSLAEESAQETNDQLQADDSSLMLSTLLQLNLINQTDFAGINAKQVISETVSYDASNMRSTDTLKKDVLIPQAQMQETQMVASQLSAPRWVESKASAFGIPASLSTKIPASQPSSDFSKFQSAAGLDLLNTESKNISYSINELNKVLNGNSDDIIANDLKNNGIQKMDLLQNNADLFANDNISENSVKVPVKESVKAETTSAIPTNTVTMPPKMELSRNVNVNDMSQIKSAKETILQLNPSVDADNVAQVSATSASTQAPEAFSSVYLKNNTAKQIEENNKYIKSLAQLGTFINEHTNRMGTVTNGVESVRQSTNQASHFDPELHLEVLRPSLEALNKETYDAKIKIYPPELGAVIAKLKVGKNGTDLMLFTENSHVKAIVESNLTQLREKFHQSDIILNSIHVSSDQLSSQHDMKGQNGSYQQQSDKFLIENGADDLSNSSTKNASNDVSSSPKGIVDTYA